MKVRKIRLEELDIEGGGRGGGKERRGGERGEREIFFFSNCSI
jgi:hypothetical protein